MTEIPITLWMSAWNFGRKKDRKAVFGER